MRKVDKPTSRHIFPSEGHFEITGVKYKGKIHTYELYGKMTDSMSQNRLAEFSRKEKEKGNPYAIGLPQFIAICDSTVKSGDKDLMNHIQSCLRKFPNTLSKVTYMPSPLKDKLVHEYGMPDEYSLIEDIMGPSGWIMSFNNKKLLESLLGTGDIKRMDEISNAINQTPMFLWRLNSKPSEKDERVVWFDADHDGLYLDAGGDPLDEYPAFRVLQVD